MRTYKIFVFVLPFVSMAIIGYDIIITKKTENILSIGVGLFTPLKHWMLEFDNFKSSTESASIEAKIPAYIFHFIFLTTLGLLIDMMINKIKNSVAKFRKHRSTNR